MTASAAQHALARSRAYDLFGRLYRDGLTPEVLPAVRSIPELAEAAPAPFDPDAAAADHYELFGLNVVPYASFFLDASGRLGGPVTDLVRHQLQQVNLAPDADAESADHLGHELAYVAMLTGAEADAHADGIETEVQRMQHLQRQFLDRHLLWWLPVFVRAVRQQERFFYVTLVDLTWELILDHRAALGEPSAGPLTPEPGDPPTDLLDDASTGLKDIANFLATPVWSGFYLSRDDITRMGRSERLPRGFGDRTQMLTNLLRSAVEFDGLDALMVRLKKQVELWRTYYQSRTDQNLAMIADVVAFWKKRLDTTEEVIGQVQTAAREHAQQSTS